MADQFSFDYKPRARHQMPGQALLAELEPDRAAHVAFFPGTGARLTDSDSARRGDITLEEGVPRLRGTKADAADRRVPVVGFALPLLEDALTYGEGEGGLMFRPWLNIRGTWLPRASGPASRWSPRTTSAGPTRPCGGTTASRPPTSPACWAIGTPDGRTRLRARGCPLPGPRPPASQSENPDSPERARTSLFRGIYGVRGRN